MNPSDDERWLDALAGRSTLDDPEEQARIDALREAYVGEAALTRLLDRLQDEGLLDAAEGEGALERADDVVVRPDFSRKSDDKAARSDVSPKPNPLYAIAASAVLLSGVLVLGYQVAQYAAPPPWASGGVLRGSIEPARVAVESPVEVSEAIAAQLRDRGIPVERYRYRGRWIVDATVIGMDVPMVNALLSEYGLVVPADGRVLLSFGPP